MVYNRSNNHSNEDVDDLWQSLRNGERNALDDLFRRFYNELFAYSYNIVADEELVKDSIQELFLGLWRRRESLSKATSVKAYLLVSVRRLILDSKLKERNRYERNRKYMEGVFEEDFTMNQVELDCETNTENKELLRVLNQLNGKQKETIFLRYYHGLSNEEIADVMDINYQSVKNNLSRAINSLRGIIKSPSDLLILMTALKQLFS